jgi:Zn-dependent protease
MSEPAGSGGNAPQRRPATWLGGGFTIARIFGIPVIVAPSWFLVALLFLGQAGTSNYWGVTAGHGAGAYGVALVLLVVLYVSVLLHELTHSLVARAMGLPVRRIVLQLLGGVSEITEEPRTPGVEYLISVAGPMTSLLLAGVGWALLAALPAAGYPREITFFFAWINTVVGVFNLLPGLPLDGGRVLRSVLWWFSRDKLSATRRSAYAGRGVSLALVAVAVQASTIHSVNAEVDFLFLLFIAFFMWVGAGQSLNQLRIGVVLPHLAARTLSRRALPVTADLPLAEAVRRANDTGSRALVVVDSRGEPDGIVSEAEVSTIPEDRRPWVNVGSLAHHVDAEIRLPVDLAGQDLLTAMQRRPATEYLVVDAGGRVYGVLAQADVVAALRAAR